MSFANFLILLVFFGHMGAKEQVVYTVLTYYHHIKLMMRMLVYTSSRHGDTLAFIWSHVSVRLVNLSAAFSHLFSGSPEGHIWLFTC